MCNSLIITTSSVAAALVVGFLGALAVARFRFYGRRALIMVVLLVQMVPFIALLIPLFLMLNSFQLTNTLPGVISVYAVLILPYTVWTLRGFIAQRAPRARRGGAGRRLHPLADLHPRDPAAGRAGPGGHLDLRLHPGVERVHHHQHAQQPRRTRT